MIKLSLFGKLAATLKLAVEQVTKNDADLAMENEEDYDKTRWKFVLPTMAKSRKQFAQLFRTKVIPEIRKALEQSYINEIPKGLFDGTLDEDEIPIKIDQKAYRARLKGYVLGAGKSKLNKLAEKSPAVKQILARMSKLEDYLGGPINAERLQKLKSLKTKDERAKRIYDIFVDDTDRLVNKVLDSGENEKFWSILAESGVNKDELIKRHLDAKMSDFAKDEKDITARANALVTTFMKKIEAKYGDAKNLLNVGGLPETPQEFVDDMFSKVIEAFISESYRTLGIRKRDKSQGEASAKSSYGHRQRDLIDHMFFVVNKRVDDYIKSRMKKTDPHGRKGGEGELDPQKDFLEEGDAFRSQQTKNWVDQIPDLSKSFTEVQADIEQFDLFSKDFEKFMSILERKARSDKSMKNVLSAFKGLAATMASVEDSEPMLDEVKELKEEVDNLMETNSEKRIRGFNFDTAYEVLNNAKKWNQTSLSFRQQFQRGTAAKEIAEALPDELLDAGIFSSEFFKEIFIPRVKKYKAMSQSQKEQMASDVFKEKQNRNPDAKPRGRKPKPIAQGTIPATSDDTVYEENKTVSRKSSVNQRERSGSLWIRKMYRDFLRNV